MFIVQIEAMHIQTKGGISFLDLAYADFACRSFHDDFQAKFFTIPSLRNALETLQVIGVILWITGILATVRKLDQRIMKV